jgi:hypothetical protein
MPPPPQTLAPLPLSLNLFSAPLPLSAFALNLFSVSLSLCFSVLNVFAFSAPSPRVPAVQMANWQAAVRSRIPAEIGKCSAMRPHSRRSHLARVRQPPVFPPFTSAAVYSSMANRNTATDRG